MDLFPDKFFKWLGLLVGIFAIIIACFNIPNLSLFVKAGIALMVSLIFIVAALFFIIVQYRDKEKEITNEYLKLYNYAAKIESDYNNLVVESDKLKEQFSATINYINALEGEKEILAKELEKANKSIDNYKKNTLSNSYLPALNKAGFGQNSLVTQLLGTGPQDLYNLVSTQNKEG